MRKSRLIVLFAGFSLLAAMIAGCSGSTPNPKLEPTPIDTAGPSPTPTPSHAQTATPTPLAIPIVDTSKNYTAIIQTEKGDLVLELYASDAPVTVSNFVFLARKGFYDNTTFHRVIPGFMAQGGDPTGIGNGGPGYFIKDEISERTHVAGALSMANRGVANTGGSQFFITYVPKHDLDGKYSVFGYLIEGKEVLNSLTPRDPAQNPDYEGDRVITIVVEES